MEKFNLQNHDYIELCDLLKVEGWSESGAAAKQVIAAGLVKVDEQTELRKRCKIKAGQIVEYNGMKILVVK